MPRLNSLEDLQRLRERAGRDLRIRTKAELKFTVGMGESGLAAGARETVGALLAALHERDLHAHVLVVEDLGRPGREPLVCVEQTGRPPVIYEGVDPSRVPQLVEAHLTGSEAPASGSA